MILEKVGDVRSEVLQRSRRRNIFYKQYP